MQTLREGEQVGEVYRVGDSEPFIRIVGRGREDPAAVRRRLDEWANVTNRQQSLELDRSDRGG